MNCPTDAVRIDALQRVREWVVGHREPDLPRFDPTPANVAKWALDEALLQIESARGRLELPSTAFRREIRTELGDAVDMYNAAGWIDDPALYHRTTPPLKTVTARAAAAAGLAYEHVSFTSGYEPWDGEPGRERWLDYENNATAHAWILRHDGAPRPWLICVNGYRTGQPSIDFRAFAAQRLHHEYGLNLAFPVSPLHGPRAVGRSGDHVLTAGAMNLVHTAAQALWDIRRLKSWLQNRNDAPAVGITGLSLGGYFTVLTASFEGDLACAIAGVPEADMVRSMRRTVEPMMPPWYEQWGLSWRSLERATRVVSPLFMEPQVPVDRRFIYAGLGDRWVRPGNVKTLWEHWEQPAICWYQGSHLSFGVEPEVRRFVRDAIDSTLLSAAHAAS